MMKHRVAVTWEMAGYIEVEADSIEEAMAKVKNHPDDYSLPYDGGEYVDGSFQLTTDDVEAMKEMGFVWLKPIGRIEYLHIDGTVRESIEYKNPYQLERDIKEENYCGTPMRVVLYKQVDGSVIPHEYISECNPPLNSFAVIDSPYINE